MSKRQNSSSVLAIVLLCCAVVYGLYRTALVLPSLQGHDQAWYLIAAERVLGGARLYGPYVSDSNPPMVVWFSILPVLLSHVTGLSMLTALRVTVIVLLLVSTAWCLRMMRLKPETQSGAVQAFVGLGIVYVLLRITPMDFGQREHLFVILALPYLFAIGTGAVDRLMLAERCALGAVTGIAVCFKPQYALALIAAEIVIAFGRRTLRRLISPEVLTLVATCGVYLMTIKIVTPAYTKDIVPLFLETYWAYGTFTAVGLLAGIRLRLLVVLLLIIVSFTLLRSRPLSRLVVTIAAAGIGAFLAYVQQGTDWPYHRLPSSAFLILAALLCIANVLMTDLSSWERYRIDNRIAMDFCAAAAVVGLAFFPLQLSRPKPQESEVYRFLAAQQKPGTVLVLSTTVGRMADILDLHWRWGGRYPCLPFLPAIVLNEQGLRHEQRPFRQIGPEKLAYLSAFQRRVIAEDLDHFRPSVVMVEHCDRNHDCLMLEGRTFDSLAWFLQDGGFARAWSQYRKQPGGMSSFDIYRRMP